MQKFCSIAALFALTTHAESITFDPSLSHEEKVELLKYDGFTIEDKPRRMGLSEVAKQEREQEEAKAEDGVYRTDPWVKGWRGFHWLINKPLFKSAVGSEADVLAYAELKHE